MADTESAQSDTQEGAVELDWIPENYRRDTLEETARVLLDSQKGAQREMAEATTARRNLEQLVAQQQAQLEQLTAAQQQATQPGEEQWEDWYGQDPIATQKALAEQSAAAHSQQLSQQFQQQYAPLAASQMEITAMLAYNQLEQDRGELSPEFKTAMSEIIAAKPHLIPDEAYRSPAHLRDVLDDVYKLASQKVAPPAVGQSQADLMRTMKLQAQTSEGASGRTPSADEAAIRWSEIQNAQTGKLGL